MKLLSILTTLLFCFGSLSLSAQSEGRTAEATYTQVDQMPQFPGCEATDDADYRKSCAYEKMIKHLSDNIVYPATAKSNKVEGTVVVSFIINKDGEITKASVTKGFDRECDAEALRVVNEMPKWNAGVQDGKRVAVHMDLPIRFSL